MFLLIISAGTMQTGIIYISIHLMFLLIGITGVIIRAGSGDFNTSHVSINQIWIQMHNVWHQYFNTSHVSINRLSAAFQICSKLNFNTSHVYINRGHDRGRCEGNGFQYISCLY